MCRVVSNRVVSLSAAFNNPFRLLVEMLEAHFTAAGATHDAVFVWLGAHSPLR